MREYFGEHQLIFKFLVLDYLGFLLIFDVFDGDQFGDLDDSIYFSFGPTTIIVLNLFFFSLDHFLHLLFIQIVVARDSRIRPALSESLSGPDDNSFGHQASIDQIKSWQVMQSRDRIVSLQLSQAGYLSYVKLDLLVDLVVVYKFKLLCCHRWRFFSLKQPFAVFELHSLLILKNQV